MTQNIEFNLGHLLTIVLIVIGFLGQYFFLSMRLSRFEGFTKAKIESLEKMLDMLFQFIKKCKHISGDYSEGQ